MRQTNIMKFFNLKLSYYAACNYATKFSEVQTGDLMLDEGAGTVTGQTEDKPKKSITYLKPLNHLKTLMADKNLIVT